MTAGTGNSPTCCKSVNGGRTAETSTKEFVSALLRLVFGKVAFVAGREWGGEE